jgi:transposase
MESACVTVGLDLGDKYTAVCVLDARGEVDEETRVRTDRKAIAEMCRQWGGRRRVVMEAGTHSPWASRLLAELGHEVVVANPRKVRLICETDRKDDKLDAERLARLGRADVKLLSPIRHRGVEAQAHLAILRSRDCLVGARTKMINHVRGMVKAMGYRLRSCSGASFHRQVMEDVPDELVPALRPVVGAIGEMTKRIEGYDREIERLCRERYPETERLLQVKGVGALTALAYVLVLEDPKRFADSRSVGAYLGLVPRLSQSGESDRQLRISKAGDEFLRRLLVSCAHYILGPFGEDSDLRRKGMEIASRGGKNAKKRAVVAVARKLAVLLHRLWVTGEIYEEVGYRARRRTQRACA